MIAGVFDLSKVNHIASLSVDCANHFALWDVDENARPTRLMLKPFGMSLELDVQWYTLASGNIDGVQFSVTEADIQPIFAAVIS
jgi:hypothetical protein